MLKKEIVIFRKFRTLVRIIRFWFLDKKMKKKGCVYNFENIKSKFYLPYIQTDTIQREMLINKNYFEAEMLDYICNQWKFSDKVRDAIRNKITLDIGANIGNHTLYFLNECNGKLVYCFEPVKETFGLLLRNIEINHLEKRTNLLNVGVGLKRAKASISFSKKHNTGYTKLEVSDTGEMEIVAIDDLRFEDKVGFVKIDVEGFEHDVLMGMADTLKKYKPFIMIEIWEPNQEKTIGLLKKLGYQVDSVDISGSTSDFICYV